MNGWTPHWPTVLVSALSVFTMTFAKNLAEQLANRLFKRKKKDTDDDDD